MLYCYVFKTQASRGELRGRVLRMLFFGPRVLLFQHSVTRSIIYASALPTLLTT